jgi:hypothetical protein
MYGKRRYGRINKDQHVTPEAIPTFVCGHCSKISKFTPKTVTLIGHQDDNSLFIVTRICQDCAKLLREWVKK